MSKASAAGYPPRHNDRFPRVRALAHWLLALVVLLALASGLVGLANTSDADPAKVAMVRGHMLIGLGVAATLLFHLAATLLTSRPPHLPSGNKLLDPLAKWVHQLLRLSVLALVVSGIVTVAESGLVEVVFENSSERIPRIVAGLPSFAVHAFVARFLLVLVGLHLLGSIYHQFRLRDGAIGRMWPFHRNGDRD